MAQTRSSSSSLSFPQSAGDSWGLQGEVAAGLLWVRLPLPFKPEDHINVWLLADGDSGDWTLIDTGLADEQTMALWRTILADLPAGKHASAVQQIRRVLVTHHHPDHIGLANWFATEHGAAVMMPAAESAAAGQLLRGDNASEMVDFYRQHGMPIERADFAELRQGFYCQHVAALPNHSADVGAGAVFHWGGDAWTALLAGGHSPAHLLLHCPARKLLISGDHILPDIITNIGALSFDPAARPVAAYLDSLDFFEALPEDTLVLPSHGLPFLGLGERCRQLRTIHQQRLTGVHSACAISAAGDTVWNMLPRIYGREMTGLGALLGFNQTKAYLDYLVAQGRICIRAGEAGKTYFQHCKAA